MKRILIVAVILTAGAVLKAQTVQQYTMYNLNHFIVNPAAAGNENFADIRMGYRKQWTGIDVAPSTYYVSGHTVLNRPKNYMRSAVRMSNSWGQRSRAKPMIKHAVGGVINSSEFGAFKRLEGTGTYALHLPLNRDISISMGLSAGFKSFSFDESKGGVLYTGDPVFDAYASSGNSNKFNMNTGVYAYSDKFYIGYSAQQLIRSEIGLSNLKIETGSERFQIYHYAMAGYHFDITNEIRLSPGFLLKKVGNNPLSYDINALLTYKQFLSAGLAYRSQDAVSVMFSYDINGILKIGYSYDYNISEIRSVSSGSNELFIGVSIYSLFGKAASF
jgi:type IX secretion system PorP/SprF family membrane protein|tara:strand:- start:1318 stop:2310 length:993 start_codon:yes stop_codon:yes gene_type:complete